MYGSYNEQIIKPKLQLPRMLKSQPAQQPLPDEDDADL